MVKVETAVQMLEACESTLPVDVAIFAAAVSDWRAETAEMSKIKKGGDKKPPRLTLVLNPDILATISAAGNARPRLVVGFAAETDDVIANATNKRANKGCDWIVANDVSPETGTFGGDANTVHLITEDGVEDWPTQSKTAVADRLTERVVKTLTAAQ
jgi:phosphopantothenoylcysteine decarboxylase/phosphopantothenate--cysteine ligase